MRRRFAAAVALGALACAPPILVRPGGKGSPTAFEVRSSAHAVYLSGTMTGWLPRRLERRGNGFDLSIELPAGRYEYRLQAEGDSGTTLLFPEGAERTPDGFGGENAVLRVP